MADTAPSMGMDSGRMDSATPNDSGGQDTGMDAVAMGGIPDPGAGNGVDNNFGNVEPNDTPQQATPLGTAMTGNVYVWVTSNTIGGSDTSDYFVFKSGPTSGTFSFNICYGAPITSLTATLWQVVNATQQLPPVGTWTANTACVSDMTMPAQLQANTEYLFGLTAVGGAGMYAA